MPLFPNNDTWAIPDACDDLGSPYAVRDYLHAAGTLSRACIAKGADEYSATPCWGNDALDQLIQSAHQKGLKVMLDVAFNHFGHNYLMYDLGDFTPVRERTSRGEDLNHLWDFAGTYEANLVHPSLLDTEAGLNAFAAGLTPSDAVVAVTRGTMEKLSRDELQGVVAHEFSHILNGDMRLNVKLAAIVFGILVIGLIGRGILRGLGRGRVRVRGKGGGALAVILAIGLAMMIIGYIGYFFGRLIQAAVSRQREFLADASAVQFTRNPGGIVGALRKIGGYALGSNLASDKAAAIGHFFFGKEPATFCSTASGPPTRRSTPASAPSTRNGMGNSSIRPRWSMCGPRASKA